MTWTGTPPISIDELRRQLMMPDKPKPGDRVRVTFETVVNRDGNFPGETIYRFVESHNVEIIKRADDPASDPIGTVRETPHGAAVKTAAHEYAWKLIHRASVFDCDQVDGYSDASRNLGKIIGAMPGTPAAEA